MLFKDNEKVNKNNCYSSSNLALGDATVIFASANLVLFASSLCAETLMQQGEIVKLTVSKAGLHYHDIII